MTIHSDSSSQLFTVRLWLEPVGGDKREMRYQVRHVLSGEIRYFRDPKKLMNFLLEKSDPDVPLDAA